MIVQDQKNIKVHFAGMENEDFARILHYIGGVKYSLFSAFYFLAPEVGINPKNFKTCTRNSPKFLEQVSNHVIMDSGLFTLMFGSHSGRRDEAFINKWYELLIQFVRDIGFEGTVVEIDCQKVLGVEKAWEFRKQMKKDLPNNRIINVFHFEDGWEGLDQLIEFSDYLAISVPELKAMKREKYTENIAKYIRKNSPGTDIHLLGCSSKHLLNRCNFATSADSTNWQQINRYGELTYNDWNISYRIKTNALPFEKKKQRYGERIKQILLNFEKEDDITEKKYDYYSNYALAGELLKKQYTQVAGNQD